MIHQTDDNDELFMFMWPKLQKRIPPSYRRCFYVFEHRHNIDEIMNCTLMKNRNFQKVLCFPKEQPLELNTEFEKFCLEVITRLHRTTSRRWD